MLSTKKKQPAPPPRRTNGVAWFLFACLGASATANAFMLPVYQRASGHQQVVYRQASERAAQPVELRYDNLNDYLENYDKEAKR